MQIHPVFHVSQLKLYKKPTNEARTYQKPDPIMTDAGQEEYEVEEIINHRKCRRGRTTKIKYLILWKGYPGHEMTCVVPPPNGAAPPSTLGRNERWSNPKMK